MPRHISYLPERYTDPFGNTTTVEYDEFDLFVQSSTDPLGNTHASDLRLPRAGAAGDRGHQRQPLEVAFDMLGLPAPWRSRAKASRRQPERVRPTRCLNPPLASPRARSSPPTSTTRPGARLARQRHRPPRLLLRRDRRRDDGSGHLGQPPRLRLRHPARDARRQLAGRRGKPAAGGVRVFRRRRQRAGQEESRPSRKPRRPAALDRQRQDHPQQQGQAGQTVRALFQRAEATASRSRARTASRRSCTTTPSAGLVRTELPDGSFSRVEFSPWHVTSFDPNDTRSTRIQTSKATGTDAALILLIRALTDFDTPEDQRAARLAALHADTPAQTFLDSLGREVDQRRPQPRPGRRAGAGNTPLLERPWHDEKYSPSPSSMPKASRCGSAMPAATW